MEKTYYVLRRSIPNPRPDRRVRDDWTCAARLPRGVYCIYSYGSRLKEVRRLADYGTACGAVLEDDPRYQLLIDSFEPAPPLVAVVLHEAHPFTAQDVLRRLVEGSVITVRHISDAGDYLNGYTSDDAEYDVTTDKWRKA